jgi:protein-disulfide isomerase
MQIDCFLSEQCGSYHQLNENIRIALEELDVSADVQYHTVSYDEAVALGVNGSPAIRINGKDIVNDGAPGVA